MQISELWRYPVKSLGGERLAVAELTHDGIAGDRIVQVVDSRGRLATARTRGGLLRLSARLGDDGEPEIDGVAWHRPAAQAAARAAGGDDLRLIRDDDPGSRFDILPLLVATDGAIAAFGRDGRRLRPNVVVGGVDGLSERDWEGAVLRTPAAAIGLHSLRDRCIVTTYDPDTIAQEVDVLLDIRRRFEGKLALNAWAVEPGELRVGDRVTVQSLARDP